jgi:hypothetical protein
MFGASLAASVSTVAQADDAIGSASGRSPRADIATSESVRTYAGDVRLMIPLTSYTYSATGAPERTVGARVSGFSLSERGREGVFGGGIAVWGAPIARLTLVAEANRNVYKDFSPSFGATYRFIGNANRGLNLGALARYKVDGFGKGPDKDEIEGELEGGALLGYHRGRLHFDTNAILGVGTTEDGDADVEARVRAGYDLNQYVRLGIDGQLRVRVAGPRALANRSSNDWVVGPQVTLGAGRFFGTLLAGPTTTGTLSANVGTVVTVAVGATTF